MVVERCCCPKINCFVEVVVRRKSIALHFSQADDKVAERGARLQLEASYDSARQLSARSEMRGVGLCGGELQACRLSGCHFIHTLHHFSNTTLGCTCRNRHSLCEVKIAPPLVDFPRVYVLRRRNITCFRLLVVAGCHMLELSRY